LSFDAKAVPFMSDALDLIAKGIVPGGTLHNAETHATFTDFAPSVPGPLRLGLSDAQTSGGLLICVARERLAELSRDLHLCGTLAATVGSVRSGSGIEVL